METVQKTTISVPEMTRLLGLKKTEGYWLVHKKQFQTVMIAGQMRIVLSSFEEWYANQTHYKKIDGPAPGYHLDSISYSIRDISKLLNISTDSVYELLLREELPTFTSQNQKRVRKWNFDEWLSQQTHYRTTEQRKADLKDENASMSLPEMGRLICLDRNQVYYLVKNTPELKTITIGNQRRVTIASFNAWYENQSDYKKFDELSDKEQNEFLALHENDSLGKQLLRRIKEQNEKIFSKDWYSVKDVATILHLSESSVKNLIKEGKLGATLVNHSWRILKQDILWFINPPNIKKEDDTYGIDSD